MIRNIIIQNDLNFYLMLMKTLSRCSRAWLTRTTSPFWLGFSQTLLLVSTPWLLAVSGIGISLWSMLLFLPSIGFVVFAPVWGRLADRYGLQPLLAINALGLTLASVLPLLLVAMQLGWLGNRVPSSQWWWWGLLVARLCHGLFAAGVMTLAQSLALQQQQFSALSAVSVQLQLGRLVAPIMLLLGVYALAFGLALALTLALLTAVGHGYWAWQSRGSWQMITGANVAGRFGATSVANEVENDLLDDPANRNIPQQSVQRIRQMQLCALLLTGYAGALQLALAPTLQRYLVAPELSSQWFAALMTAMALLAVVCQRWLVPRLRLPNCGIPAWPIALLVGYPLVLVLANSLPNAAAVWLLTIATLSLSPALTLVPAMLTWHGRQHWQLASGQLTSRLAQAYALGYPVGGLVVGYWLAVEPASWPCSLIFLAMAMWFGCSRLGRITEKR